MLIVVIMGMLFFGNNVLKRMMLEKLIVLC